jgi:hypothetical protein
MNILEAILSLMHEQADSDESNIEWNSIDISGP